MSRPAVHRDRRSIEPSPRPHRAARAIAAILITGLVAVTSACGGAASPAAGPAANASGTARASATAAPVAKTKVKMMLDYLPSVGQLGFVEAAALGYYADAGLEVELTPGRGSAPTLQFVGSDQAEFGYADGATLAVQVAAGVPVKMVAGIFQTGSNSIAFLCDRPVAKPADLKGISIGGPAGAAGWVALGAAMEKAGLPADAFKRVTVATEAKADALFGGTLPVVTTTLYDLSINVRLAEKGKKVCQIPISDWGAPMMGQGIITTDKILKSNPDLVSRFVAASLKGWDAAVANPSRGIADMFKLFPDAYANPAQAEDCWKLVPQMFHTPASTGTKLGWMAPEDWVSTLTILQSGGILQQPLKPEQVYTNQFVQR
ncbi:MAG: NitT/TauT family transport system substrate-binding protein [Chloroflexota bacterium]|nr:NitT/TauT family transport system substrate-binding protein [Chloroflexota bacterium]